MRELLAITLVCLSAPLQSLTLDCAHKSAGTPEAIETAQLSPLKALSQLLSLTLLELDSFGAGLLGTLRHLTQLTSLRLAASARSNAVHCQVFEVATALTRLELLSVTGTWRTTVQDLPTELYRLRLRDLEIRNVRMTGDCGVLRHLWRLERLVVLWDNELTRDDPERIGSSTLLPLGMDGLRSLRELRITCDYGFMWPVTLPALEIFHLDAHAVGEVSAV